MHEDTELDRCRATNATRIDSFFAFDWAALVENNNNNNNDNKEEKEKKIITTK